MKLVICVVRDSAADAYGVPMFVPTVGIAVRSFTDGVNRAEAENQLYQHPEDFVLYEAGTFDDQTARIEMLPDLRQLARASDLKR